MNGKKVFSFIYIYFYSVLIGKSYNYEIGRETNSLSVSTSLSQRLEALNDEFRSRHIYGNHHDLLYME